eukprot:NODE_6882_length_484_cov_159.977011_g6086_i0.p3 GENE.NODE_6882_length_484_cov_159.977011_g6086_i0~~NODE_6882_length_484_cov_159.977011_g6086_i0.p3  ORF type:complete len:68 (-),score=6.15 NODE_6882_length_484_cov_159.977011_g6086_i0:87-290(-)
MSTHTKNNNKKPRWPGRRHFSPKQRKQKPSHTTRLAPLCACVSVLNIRLSAQPLVQSRAMWPTWLQL